MDLSLLMKHLRTNARHRPLMTRIMFNRMGWAQAVPVDISELHRLSGASRAAINGFLDWSRVHHDVKVSERSLDELRLWRQPEVPSSVAKPTRAHTSD